MLSENVDDHEKFTRFPHALPLARSLSRGVSSCLLFPQVSRKFRDHQRVINEESAKNNRLFHYNVSD